MTEVKSKDDCLMPGENMKVKFQYPYTKLDCSPAVLLLSALPLSAFTLRRLRCLVAPESPRPAKSNILVTLELGGSTSTRIIFNSRFYTICS